MFLSVIIPCYNCESNIMTLLRTLCGQLDHENTEVILINDGSNDNTATIIEEFIYRKKLSNFYLFSYPNSGAANARTTGLKKARGDYIFFIDSDDSISDGFYAAVLDAAQLQPDMIYFSSSAFDVKDKGQLTSNKIKIESKKIYTVPSLFLNDMLLNGMWTCAVWSYVFRREHAIDSCAYFTNRTAHEDLLFTLRMLGHAKTIYALDDLLYYQYESIGSLTRSAKTSDYIFERINAYEESVNDISDLFATSVIRKYKQWSIDSIKSLIVNNKKLIPKLMFNVSIYVFFIRNACYIFNLVLKKLSKDIH
ncbi:glycosyltransferase family 2 protein [Raoultella ornithinolytica]